MWYKFLCFKKYELTFLQILCKDEHDDVFLFHCYIFTGRFCGHTIIIAVALTLSLPRVINFNFLFQSLTRDILYNMENLAIDSLLRWKLIEQSFLTTLLNHFLLEWLGEFALRVKLQLNRFKSCCFLSLGIWTKIFKNILPWDGHNATVFSLEIVFFKNFVFT